MIRRALNPRVVRRAGLILLALGGLLLLASFVSPRAFASSAAPDATATPFPSATPTFDMARLDKPPANDPPTQLDTGATYFWGVCMACHGDRGQGLTDEWRDSFGEDNNCWVSKCHASNHPPQGFEFPRVVPALAGPGTLARFVNAQQLYEYNRAKMPWWNPGSLSEENAWAVTAYVLKLNSTLPENVTLNAANAQFVPVRYNVTPGAETPWKLLLALTCLLAAVIVGAQRLGAPHRRPSFILHLHPPAIPALQARWRHTLGAGGLAVFLCLILLVTGLLEMYYYIPSPERAAQSIQEIAFLVPYGGLVRNLHYWSAQALTVIATVHLLRVLFTGAYNKPRRFNYLLGMGLLAIILLLNFTGYVLRWDEGIRWALVAGTNLLATIPAIGERVAAFVAGGVESGPAMLIRYYAWHIFGLTALGGFVLVWHLFRVRRDGGIAAPPVTQTSSLRPEVTQIENLRYERIPRRELLRREAIAMLAASGALILLASVLPAPIAQPMNLSLASLAESRAPWFFLWVQELLKLGDPFLFGILTPLLLLAFLSALPYLLPRLAERDLGRWFPRSGRAVQIIAILVTLALLLFSILALIPATP